ncbi:MAG: ABC transporter permease [Firmicutes bacterium]|mgnify:FL=1|nr:ABC transporter permease [Bacillota bacterium]
MNLFDTARLAIGNIWASKMRTFLTMLGIIIGVSAVILIEGLGNGLQVYMEDAFDALGTSSIEVILMGRGSTRNADVEDMYQLLDENPQALESMTPTVTMSGVLKIGNETYSKTAVTGVSEDYLDIKSYEIEKGRNLQYMDMKDRKAVCLVGSYVDQTYFKGRSVGETLKVGKNKLTVVGVVAQEEEELREGGTDDIVLLPYTSAARYSMTGQISRYTFTATDPDHSDEAVDLIEARLYEIYGTESAYMIVSMAQLLDTFSSMLNVMITILAIIAGISLVVGGIGIMNIMLVSVTERTREIGIRKALGAKETVILSQFVTEAAVTSVIGGIFGIGFGILMCRVATKLVVQILQVKMSVIPDAQSIAMAVGVSAGIGILFGYLPAKKAANLNPIDALRYE